MLAPTLASYDLPSEGPEVHALLKQLRKLSGRVALKLISSAQPQRAEVLGLGLAYAYLQQQKKLDNQIIIPLDEHAGLFRQANKPGDVYAELSTLQRTDLALFDLNAKERRITCQLIEIKCYAQSGEIQHYSKLKETIREQLNNSERVLKHHFAASQHAGDRPDRLFKTHELTMLLTFYLERGLRYKQIEHTTAVDIASLLKSLEQGYQLAFTRSALIFDFSQPGTEPADHEEGIEYQRIGVDLIRSLMAELAQPSEEQQAQADQLTPSSPPVLETAAALPSQEERAALVDMQAESDSPAALIETSTPEETQATGGPRESEAQQNELMAEPLLQDAGDQGNTGSFPETEHLGSRHSVREAGMELRYDILLGATQATSQYGILGEVAGRRVAFDLDQPQTLSLFGVQGGGKSYTLGSIIEMSCLPIPQINNLVTPRATMLFHYSPTRDYRPEFISMAKPNSVADELAILQERYGAIPRALKDIVLLVPKAQMEERQAEFPGTEIHPITFASSELKATHWRFLMGAVGSQSMYLRQITAIMRKLRNELTLANLLREIERSTLADNLKELARTRLNFTAEYIDDHRRLSDLIRPGRLIIVDLRDEFIEKDEALGLFVVLLHIFSEATYQGQEVNKLVVFDEAHKYIQNEDLTTGLVEVVREMRHKRTSILVASQEPRSVPQSLIELSTQIILHRFNSPDWLKYIQRTNTALNALTPEKMNSLEAGEAYVWSSKATDHSFSTGAIKIRCRPRVTHHGGATKTAVKRSEE